jgi:multidrug resistance efflux pump
MTRVIAAQRLLAFGVVVVGVIATGAAPRSKGAGAQESSPIPAQTKGTVVQKKQEATRSEPPALDVTVEPTETLAPAELLRGSLTRPREQASSITSYRSMSAAGSGLTDLAIRLRLARKRAEWSAGMVKQNMVSPRDHEQQLIDVQVLEAQLGNRIFDIDSDIELLEVQREERVAEIDMAKANVDRSKIQLARLRELEAKGPGYATKSEVDTAAADLRYMEASLTSRRAALKEVDVRVAQLKKRLERLKTVPPDVTPAIDGTPARAPAAAPKRP